MLTAAIGVCGFAYAAGARLGASVARGSKIAMTACSACHLAAERQGLASMLQEPRPALQEIADNPDTSAASMRQLLRTRHLDWETPPTKIHQRDLTPGQSEDVIR